MTAAVTSGAGPEPEPGPAPDNDVFGKVAQPGGDGPGARMQDVELFDDTPSLPSVSRAGGSPARHRAGKPRHGRKTTRARKVPRARKAAPVPEPERRGGMALPLLITGALTAGLGLSVGLTSGMEREPADKLTLTMPDLAPHLETASAEPPPPTGTSTATPPPPATTPATTPPTTPTGSGTATATPPSSGAATARPAVSPGATATAAPRNPAPASAPPTRPATHRPDPAPTRTRTAPPPERPDSGALRLGSTGPEVADLQRRLQELYLFLGSADGVFDPFVEAALSRFQRARDIPEERGVYGPLTRAALQAETGRGDRSGHGGNPWGRWSGLGGIG
ncbi:peptidoglycan-binding protein [Streptomyces sp. NPDC015130]|uniref:peptidoglycan-binding domain-containing protein n=1 Tax=Streptomyces sp. NPDC015130 TaxID=3364940 RepID=UPI0036F6973F